MYLLKTEFKTIKSAFEELAKNGYLMELPNEIDIKVNSAFIAMSEAERRYKDNLRRIADNVAEHRKIDKTYGRPKQYRDKYRQNHR